MAEFGTLLNPSVLTIEFVLLLFATLGVVTMIAFYLRSAITTISVLFTLLAFVFTILFDFKMHYTWIMVAVSIAVAFISIGIYVSFKQ